MAKTAAKRTSGIRELFIEELASIQGGSLMLSESGGNTTMACCEEGPFGCCHLNPLDDLCEILDDCP